MQIFLLDSCVLMSVRWVPIKNNDWYWIRHHIKVGMPVIVEILVSSVLQFLYFYYLFTSYPIFHGTIATYYC